MRCCAIILVLGLSACAITLTDEEKGACVSAEEGVAACEANLIESKKEDMRYRIEDRNTQFRDEYYRFFAQCKAGNGTIYIKRTFPRANCRGTCPPEWGDSYWCQ